MSFDDVIRIFAGACALFGTLFIVRWIIIGRGQLGGSTITREQDPKLYWLLIARFACSYLGMALDAALVPERFFGPVLVLSIFAPALAFALLTGRFEWEADKRRIDSPRRFWGWVTFYGLMIALFALLLVVEVFRTPALPAS
jgi:hypothetical protein